MARAAKSIKRTRRIFSAKFKQEAVRRMAERRAQGVSVPQIGRDVDVRPEMLRVWARQLAAQGGAPLVDVFPGQGRLPSELEEVRRLEREVKRLAQANAFLKVRRRTSRGSRDERPVRRHYRWRGGSRSRIIPCRIVRGWAI